MRFRTISLLLSLSQFLQSLRRSSLSFSSFASPCSLVGGRCQREETGRGRRHDVGASLHLLSESRLGRLGGKHSCLASRHKLPALLLFDFWTYDGPEKEPSLHLQKIQRGKCSSSHSCAVWGTSLKQDEKGFQQQENSRSRLSREPLSSRSTCFRWICTLRRQYRGIRCFARSAQTAVPRRQKRKILTVGPLGRLPSAYCRCPSSSHLGEIGGGMFETKVRERGPAEHSTLSTATEDDVNTECFRTGQFLWRDWRCFPFSKMMDRRRTSRQRMKKRRRRGRRGGTQEAPSELRGSCGYGIQHFLLSDVVLAHSSQSSVVRPRDGVSTLLRCTATQNDQCLYTPLRDEALLSCLLSMSPKTGCSTARRCFSGSSSSFLVSPSSRNRIGDLHTRRGRLRRSLYGSRERPLPTLAGTRISPCSTSYSPLGASLHKQQSSFPSSSLSAFSSSSSSVSLPRLCIFFPRGSLPLIGDGTSPTEGRRPSPPAGSNASPERAHVPPSGLASAVEGLTESKSFVNQGNGSVEGDLLLQCLPCASPASLPKNLKQLMQNNHGGSHDAPEAFFYPGRQMPFLFFLHSFPRPSGHHRGKGDRESPSAKENKNLTTEEETLKTPHFCRNAESAAEVSACQLPPPLGLPIVYTSFLLPPSFPRDHPLQPQKLARLFAELMKDVPRERQPSANQAQDDASHSGGKETADSESCRRKLPSSGGVFGQHLVGHKETMGRRDSRRKEKLDKEEEQVDRETNEASEGALSVSRKPLRGHRSVWRGDGAVDSTTPGDAAAAWLGGEEARKHFSLQNNGGGEGELMMSKGSANLQSSPVPSTEKVELQQEESEKGEEGRNQDKNEIGNCAGRGGERERFSSIRKPNNKQWEPNLYPGNSDTSLFSPVLDEDIICSWLRSVHTPEYVTAAASATLEEREQRKVGLPVTRGYVRKSLAEVRTPRKKASPFTRRSLLYAEKALCKSGRLASSGARRSFTAALREGALRPKQGRSSAVSACFLYVRASQVLDAQTAESNSP